MRFRAPPERRGLQVHYLRTGKFGKDTNARSKVTNAIMENEKHISKVVSLFSTDLHAFGNLHPKALIS